MVSGLQSKLRIGSLLAILELNGFHASARSSCGHVVQILEVLRGA